MRSSQPMRLMSTRIALILVSVVLFSTLAAQVSLVFVWQQHTEVSPREQALSIATISAQILGQRYESVGGWTSSTIESLPHLSNLSDQVGIEVISDSGEVLYSDLADDARALGFGARELTDRVTVPVLAQDRVVGSVYVFRLSDADPGFERSARIDTYIAVFLSGLIAMALAALVGVFYARRLVDSAQQIIAVTEDVRAGDLKARIDLKNTQELARLGRAIDEMLDTFENAKNLEHQLTTDVAHELRTPLMAMQATIEAMMDGVLPLDSARLSILNSEVIRLGHLVDAQLQLSRLETGKTTLKIEAVDLSYLVKSLAFSHEMLIEDAELTFDSTIDPDVFVRGDADLLRQAVANLLSNAVRYTAAGGHINVQVHSQMGLAQVFVSDTGEGIAAADIPHIFSRFWRATSSRERESGGLGVGLTMVKEIAMRHRGFVNVESELGVGSTFTIILPLLKQPSKPNGKVEESDRGDASGYSDGDGKANRSGKGGKKRQKRRTMKEEERDHGTER